MKKLIAIILCVLMLVSVISACSSGDSDTEENDNSGSEIGNITNEGVISGSATTEKADEKPEGWTTADATESIHVTVTSTANSLERWAVSGTDTITLISWLITDPVLSKDEEGNIIPWLCDEWEMAEDSMSVVMHIREGVHFTNGNLLTASDIAFTLETIRDSERYPDSIAKSWRNYVDTVELIDEYTFKINFKQLMPEFWVQITDPKMLILDKKVYEEEGADTYWEHPEGTGAYCIKSWDSANTEMELEIRTDEYGYFAYDLYDTWTNVKYITIEYSPEAQTRLASLRTGETDILALAPTTDIGNLINEGYTVEQLLPTAERFVQFACGEGNVFNDAKLREAFSLCIDRELLAETIMNGYATAISWPAREGQLGYVENPEKTYTYDPDRARELVEESSYNGEELTLIATTSTVQEATELAVALQSMASEVGINIAVRTCENAIYSELRTSREFDLCLANIGGGLNNWYMTVAEVIGQDRFNSGTTNKVLMEEALKVMNTVDMDALQEIYENVYNELLNDYDCMTLLYCPMDAAAYNSRITNVKHCYTNYLVLREVVVKDA